MPERAIRILLVDDHALFRQGLRQLLATTPDIVVVGEAGSASEAFELVPQLAPDVVLMDIAMPGLDGIAATAALRQRFPTLRVVMLTMYEPTTSGEAARAAGAIAYVVKSSRPEELFAAIRAAANGAIPPNGEVRAGQSPPPPGRDTADRVAQLEQRLAWLEAQLAQLGVREPLPPSHAPAEPVTSAPPADQPIAPSPPVAAVSRHPVWQPSIGTARAADTMPTPRSVSPQPLPVALTQLANSLLLGILVVGELVALASALLLFPSPILARWITLGAGQLASLALIALVALAPQRRSEGQIVLLVALTAAMAWSLLTARSAPVALQAAALAGTSSLALAALALSWQRRFLLAAALSLALITLLPSLLAIVPGALAPLWVTGTVALASGLAWSRLRRPSDPVAWEWLPLAPLALGIPLLLVWLESGGRPALLLAAPWIAAFPPLVAAGKAQRPVLRALLALHGALALGTVGWLFRTAAHSEQAAALAVLAVLASALALLLWWSGQRAGASTAPAVVPAAFAGLSLALAAARHPEPVLAPLVWCTLGLVLAALPSRCTWSTWIALALFAGGCGAALLAVLRSPDWQRWSLLVLVLGTATMTGPFLAPRWWFVTGWLGSGVLALAALLALRLTGLVEIAALSGLALGTLVVTRYIVPRLDHPTGAWVWLPTFGASASALASALTGPLSPGRLGIALQPAVSATSEPVIAASMLVAAALAAGRLLGRRWRWAAIAIALLLIAYVLPAVVPDAALVLSWSALAVALAHALGIRLRP
jgi:DNA-binding NarL/FixJ family response regulator